MSVLSRLADGFEVHLDSVVKHVEVVKRGEGENVMAVRVTDTRGNESIADRVRPSNNELALILDTTPPMTHTHTHTHTQVIVTVPLAVLKANMVTFTPALSTRKKCALEDLGAGLVEKVYLMCAHNIIILIKHQTHTHTHIPTRLPSSFPLPSGRMWWAVLTSLVTLPLAGLSGECLEYFMTSPLSKHQTLNQRDVQTTPLPCPITSW